MTSDMPRAHGLLLGYGGLSIEQIRVGGAVLSTVIQKSAGM
jgi:hypothetical protein